MAREGDLAMSPGKINLRLNYEADLEVEDTASKIDVLRRKLHVKSERGKTELDEVHVCPYCGNEQLLVDYKTGEVVCPRCGSVVVEHLVDFEHPEYRVFAPEDVLDKERVKKVDLKAPELDLGQDEIRPSDASPKMRSIIARLSKIHARLKLSSQERNIINLERFVKNIVQRYGLQPVLVDEVIYMYRMLSKAIDRRMFRLRELAVALLYIACRRHGITFRFREILEEVKVSKRRFGKLVNTVKQILLKVCPGLVTVQSIINENEIKAYVHKILNNLNIPDLENIKLTAIKLVLDLVRKCRDAHLTNGRSIYSIVAASVYIVLTLINIKKKQKEVADAANISDVTVRARYREIIDKIHIVVYV